MRIRSAPGTWLEQVLAYAGTALLLLVVERAVRRTGRAASFVDWQIAIGLGALLALSVVEVWDWWRRTPARSFPSSRRHRRASRTLPIIAWFAAAAIPLYVVVRGVWPDAWVVAMVAGLMGGKVLSSRLSKGSDRRDGRALLRGAGLDLDEAEPIRRFEASRSAVVLAEESRTFIVDPFDPRLDPRFRKALGLARRHPAGCLVFVDPALDEGREREMLGRVARALTSRGLDEVVHLQWRWNRRGLSPGWELAKVGDGTSLRAQLVGGFMALSERVDVISWSDTTGLRRVVALKLPYDDSIRDRLGSEMDDDSSWIAFLAFGDGRSELLVELEAVVAT